MASDSKVIFVNITNQAQLNYVLMGTVWLLGLLQAFFLLHSNESDADNLLKSSPLLQMQKIFLNYF